MGTYAAMALNVVQGVLFARILGPEIHGQWLGLQFLLIYGMYFGLGLPNSILRQIPLLEGKGERDRLARLNATGNGAMLVHTAGWLALGVVLTLLFYRNQIAGAACFIAAAALEGWFLLGLSRLKAAGRFWTVGMVTAGRAVLQFALLPLVAAMLLSGALVRVVLLGAAIVVVVAAVGGLRGGVRFARGDYQYLQQDGIPVLLVGLSFTVQTTLDRLMIAAHMGPTELGLYGVASILMSLMIVIPGVVGQTSYPGMLRSFGREGEAWRLWAGVRSRSVRVAAVSLFCAVIAWFALPPAVRWALPRFEGGIAAAQWLLPGAVCIAVSLPSTYALQALGKQRWHLLWSALGLALHVVLVLVVLRRVGTIESVSQATSVAFALYAAMILLATRRAVLSDRPGQASPAAE